MQSRFECVSVGGHLEPERASLRLDALGTRQRLQPVQRLGARLTPRDPVVQSSARVSQERDQRAEGDARFGDDAMREVFQPEAGPGGRGASCIAPLLEQRLHLRTRGRSRSDCRQRSEGAITSQPASPRARSSSAKACDAGAAAGKGSQSASERVSDDTSSRYRRVPIAAPEREGDPCVRDRRTRSAVRRPCARSRGRVSRSRANPGR